MQVIQRLLSIVDFWADRRVFGPETIAQSKQAITSPPPTQVCTPHPGCAQQMLPVAWAFSLLSSGTWPSNALASGVVSCMCHHLDPISLL